MFISNPKKSQTDEELKRTTQNWLLDDFKYQLFITIEPLYSFPMSDDEIRNRLRTIEFLLCKEFLSSKFSLFKDEDRFWYVGFFHGERCTRERHTHICLTIPYHKFNKEKHIKITDDEKNELVKKKFLDEWFSLGSYYSIGDKHNPKLIEKQVPNPHILDLKDKNESTRSVVYSSRQIGEVEQYEDFYFSRT